MTAIKRITNPDPLVQEKVNYFLDMINHSVSYAGWQWSLELESPTSLLQKVSFRLKEEKDYRLLYYDNYFKQPFFTEDTFWNSYSTYSKVKQIVWKYKQLGKSKKDEKKSLLTNSIFQINVTKLLEELIQKMPGDLINGVLTNVLCPHKLDELIPNTDQTHASFFKSVALILVSEYFFRGYTRSEIREIVSRVFSKDYSFPFPTNVKTRAQRDKYLAEGTLKNQLNGFANVFNEKPEKGVILVKVFGANFPDKFEFEYDRIRFFGKNHPWIMKAKEKMTNDDKEAFFKEGNYLLAVTEISWISHDSLMEKTVSVIRRELTFLSAILNRELSVDTTKNYVRFLPRLKYAGMGWSSRQFEDEIAVSVVDQLNDNPYSILRNLTGSSIEWFLKYENLFVVAKKNNSLSDYWLYLETLLSYNRSEKKVMGIVSSILLTNEKQIRNKRILTTLLNIIATPWDGIDLLKISLEKWKIIIKDIQKEKIAKEIREVEYPFIQELILEFDSKMDSSYYKKAKEYYYSILIEAYEYRNFFVHQGLEGEALKDKLTVTLPIIVVRVRWAILKALQNGKESSPFDLIIDDIETDGELLLIN